MPTRSFPSSEDQPDNDSGRGEFGKFRGSQVKFRDYTGEIPRLH